MQRPAHAACSNCWAFHSTDSCTSLLCSFWAWVRVHYAFTHIYADRCRRRISHSLRMAASAVHRRRTLATRRCTCRRGPVHDNHVVDKRASICHWRLDPRAAYTHVFGYAPMCVCARACTAMTATGIVFDWVLELTYFAASLAMLHPSESGVVEKKKSNKKHASMTGWRTCHLHNSLSQPTVLNSTASHSWWQLRVTWHSQTATTSKTTVV
jgi:hypothetical protein